MTSSITSESRNVETTSESDLLGLYCPTCHTSFEKDEQFKLHYHSDIHHYNMKRKIVGLKPASEEQFLKQIQKMQVEKEKTDKRNQSYYCEVLNQKFSNYATFAGRLNTKKYQKALETYKEKSKDVTEKKDEPQEEISEKILEETPADGFKKKKNLPTTLESTSICLFTNVLLESFEKNLEHMRKKFGFFILDEKCCTKKEELIKYLARVIHKDFTCIYCQQKFKSADSCQKHMVSKEHTMMNSEYFGQYERFYDFREENRRIAKELEERFKHIKADNQFVYMIKNKAESDPAVDNDEDWEDEEDSKEMDNDELIEKYNIRRARKLDTGELLLPSGRIAGHKDYLKYYKQSLRLKDPDNPIRQMMQNPALKRQVLRDEQALVLRASGYAGKEAQVSLRTYNNFLIGLRKKADKVNHTNFNRLKGDWMRLGVSHNKLQKYFRDRNIIFG